MQLHPASKTYVNSRGEQVIELGVSASREGLSDIQKAFLLKVLVGKTGILHHGDCIGGDADIHDILKAAFPDKWRIHIHPPTNDSLRAFKVGDLVAPAKPYLERNRDIVNPSNVFLAFPKSPQQIGGTWSTVNYFRTVLEWEYKQDVPPRIGTIVMPNGDIGNILADSRRLRGHAIKDI